MIKKSTKEVIICIIAIVALALTLTSNVFATTPNLNDLLNSANTNNEFNSIPENNTANNTVNNTANNTVNNTANNTVNNTANNTKNNATNNNTRGNNTVIPDAGLDQSILFIIAIFGISAVYAYKKIRNYKNV